jgi:ADP-heptose:LPS heptosyltransferase
MSNKNKLKKYSVHNTRVSNITVDAVDITKTKYRFAIYKLNDTIQLPVEFGGAVLVKDTITILPINIVNNNIATPIKLFETQFIEVNENTNLNNKNVLIIRNGGIGDILASFFGIIELKRKFKNINIGYLAEYKNLTFINSFPNIINFATANIIPLNNVEHFTHIIYLEDLVENNNDISIQELFAKQMTVSINNETLATLHNYFCPTKKIRNGIGIQYKSNAVIRNYSIDNFIKLINLIHTIYPDMKIYLLGPPNDYVIVNYIQVNVNFGELIITNGCGNNQLSIADMFTLTEELELVISVDSSMSHISGLTNTPLIGLFGPFHSSKRIKYYNNCIGINGKTNCSPCNRHDPYSFCKYTNGEGACINSITPELIMDNIIKLIGKKNDT